MSSAPIPAVVDLAEIFEPAEFWPDIETCPDWPVTIGNNPHPTMQSKADVERALEHLRASLNRAGAPLRSPTASERKLQRMAIFRAVTPQPFADPDEQNWTMRHGISGFTSARPGDDRPHQIIEATHIRGYLMKLEARAERGKQIADAAAIRQAESTIERGVAEAVGLAAEYETLTAAIARQKQREDDERACRRAMEIKRDQMPGLHSSIRIAANKLGRQMPEVPHIE